MSVRSPLVARLRAVLCQAVALGGAVASVLAPSAVHAQAVRFDYDRAPLRTVVADLERRTPLRVLARDAVLDRCRVTVHATGTAAVLDALRASLAPQGVRVEVRGTQVVLVETAATDDSMEPAVAVTRVSVAGRVRDAATRAGVPYASVTWHEDGATRGAAADADGAFSVSLPPGGARVSVASVGYRTATRTVDGADGRLDVSLAPVPVPGSETVVVGWRLDSGLDSAFSSIAARRSAPGTAEPSVRRALEAFPSVGVGAAFAEGPRVRGLRADGFEVLLDGVPVYNPTHLFGLYDAFNPDALDPVAFYYDATPARFSGPPAGTLAFATRRGAPDTWETSAAAGSIAARGTVAGPVGMGATALVAVRASLVGRLPFPGSARLVRTGLDAGRETSGEAVDASERVTIAEASFVDGHVRLDRRIGPGDLALSVYGGGDVAESEGERTLPTSRVNATPVVLDVATRNRWGSAVGSAAYTVVRGRLLGRLTAGASRYHARFGKDDFAYRLPGGPRPNAFSTAYDTLGYRNDLLDTRVGLSVDRVGDRVRWTVGALGIRYATTYEEQAARAPRTLASTTVAQLDVYGDAHAAWRALTLDAGLRLHRFDGLPPYLTPRVRLAADAGPVTAFAAAHTGVQFLHRLYFDGQPGASVWVTTAEDERPTTSQGVSTGLAWRAGAHAVQAEAYARRYAGLRQHATSAVVARRGESVVSAPWATDVDGRGRGLELLYRGRVGSASSFGLDATAAYTLARMDLRDGADAVFVRAPDDRTHQARVGLSASMLGGLGLDVAAAAASGTPDPLDATTDPATLGPYRRVDAALRFGRRVGGADVRVALSVYNVLDRDNPWYREAMPVVEPRTGPGGGPRLPQVTLVPVDVYDLGRTPSFEIAVRW